jgi:hypothetical protein
MEALAGLSEYRLLDRLIRGRIWIGLVAFALIGIVTLQLGLLKLNGDIGRALEREALVQRENAVLSIENSELTASDGVESRAARLGMEFVPQGALRSLTAGAGVDTARLTAALSTQARSAGASAHSSAESPSSTESSAGSESSASSSTTAASSSEGASAQATAPSGGESPGTASTAPNAGSGESATGPAPESATESARAAPSAPSSSAGAGGAGTAVAAGGGTQASAAGE